MRVATMVFWTACSVLSFGLTAYIIDATPSISRTNTWLRTITQLSDIVHLTDKPLTFGQVTDLYVTLGVCAVYS